MIVWVCLEAFGVGLVLWVVSLDVGGFCDLDLGTLGLFISLDCTCYCLHHRFDLGGYSLV